LIDKGVAKPNTNLVDNVVMTASNFYFLMNTPQQAAGYSLKNKVEDLIQHKSAEISYG